MLAVTINTAHYDARSHGRKATVLTARYKEVDQARPRVEAYKRSGMRARIIRLVAFDGRTHLGYVVVVR